VSNLRTALDGRIASDGRHYSLETGSDEVDAVRFASLMDQADGIRTTDPGRAVTLLTEAEALWRGRPFGDIGDCSILVERRAAELEAMHMHAVESRLRAQMDLAYHDRVIPELTSLVAAQPYHEVSHRLLMIALYRAGRQADALRVGFALRERLVEDLGIEPTPETRALEDRILRQDADLDLAPPTNLPMFASSFVGRDLETADVVKRLDVHRLVTLVGVGGIGKTRLAVESARRSLERFPDGAWWVDLAPVETGLDTASRVATALNLADQPGVDARELVRRFIAKRSMLIVLDNCEHLVADVERFVTDMLQGAPGLTVLATSRRRLNAPGEHRYEVPAMSLPAGTLGGSDAERLFLDRATGLDDTFTIDSSTIADVARICVDLGGHPFAIELAAGRITMMSPSDIAGRLGDHLGFLRSPPRTESHHEGIAAAIEWSHDLLTEPEQTLFDRLSVFVGPFDFAAVEAVSTWQPLSEADVLDAFNALIDASMVARERLVDGSVRFRLLEMMKSFGRLRLQGRGESFTTAQHHAVYHLGAVEASADLAFTPQHRDVIQHLGSINDDVEAALDWALGNHPVLVTSGVVAGFAHYWFHRGDPSTAYTFGKRLLNVDPPSPVFTAGAHIAYGFGCQLTGDPQAAFESLNIALPILEGGHDWRLLLFAYNGQGQGGVMAGIPGLSAAMGARILEICDEHELDLPRGYGLALLGEEEFFHDGDLDEAEKKLEAAIPLFRAIGDDVALNMFGLGILGSIQAVKGNLEAAERTLAEASTSGGPGWSATALITMGTFVLIPRGELDRAEDVILTGLGRVYERSMEAWIRPALLMLARIAAEREEWETAARLFGACRPQLISWAHHPRYWVNEPRVRDALGTEAFDRLAALGAAEPVDDLVTTLLNDAG
jgi:predicted ATPase